MSNRKKKLPTSRGLAPVTGSVVWVDARKQLPDDDLTVLIALADGEVWTGFQDAGLWRYVSADRVESEVTYWAQFPDPPNCCKHCGGTEDPIFSRIDDGGYFCPGCGNNVDDPLNDQAEP